jgi:hypothetical protein
MASNVTTVGPQASDQQLIAALMMGGFANNTTINNMLQIADWESSKTPKVNASPSESPQGFSGCSSNGVWQINYCPSRDKGTIREQVANNPGDLVLNARAAYLLSNGGQNLNIWTTWKNRNATNPSTAPSGTVPMITSDTSPILGHVTNDPASLKAAGITSTINGCAPPTGLNAMNPAAWIGYLVCAVRLNALRAGEIVLGVILIIVGIMILAKIAGDKTGATQVIQGAATAAAVA